jgi:hypothetical protein
MSGMIRGQAIGQAGSDQSRRPTEDGGRKKGDCRLFELQFNPDST